MPSQPRFIATLVGRFDASVFDSRRRHTRIRLKVRGIGAWDVLVDDGTAAVQPAGGHPDAVLCADRPTWTGLAADIRNGMSAYLAGRLSVRRNLHVGVAFLAATSRDEPGRLRFRTVATNSMRLSTLEAGTGPAVLALHGLGATKGSFLPTVAALADRFRVIAVDLPGFGDSDKPIGAAYDARFFADTAVELLDTLSLPWAHVIGNSLGGRVAIEIALGQPERVGRLALLAPSLAWRRDRPLLSLLRLTRPELGLVQLAPRPLVQAVINHFVPGAGEGWAAAGADEFLRAYLTPSGRAAFYAAARHIYLDEPYGKRGFWTRLPALGADALFIWGRRDRIVPIGFARHVETALPRARHLELDCGHVAQVERPVATHEAIGRFLSAARPAPAGFDDGRGPSTLTAVLEYLDTAPTECA